MKRAITHHLARPRRTCANCQAVTARAEQALEALDIIRQERRAQASIADAERRKSQLVGLTRSGRAPS